MVRIINGDEDGEDFASRLTDEAKNGDRKPNTSSSKHPETEQRSKINERVTRSSTQRLHAEIVSESFIPPDSRERNLYMTFLKLRMTNTGAPRPLSELETLKRLCSIIPKLWDSSKPGTDLDMKFAKILREANASCEQEHESVKLLFLSELLPDIIKEKECVLIFSQYLGMLDAVEALVKSKYKYLRLDGRTKPQKRAGVINEFQSGDIPIFLLSYKVGALGFNLTKASRVILLDPSWNPTTDDQAVDRAYRIKQTKSVLVYRLLCCSTVEERIYYRQILKNTLSRMIVGKQEPLRIFREQDIVKAFDVQEKDFNSSSIKKIIDTQLMKSGQHKM